MNATVTERPSMRVFSILLPLLLITFLPGSAAQDPLPEPPESNLYDIELEAISSGEILKVDESINYEFRLYDLSRDATGRFLGEEGGQTGLRFHHIKFEIDFHTQDVSGWSVARPSPVFTRGGDVVVEDIPIAVNYQVKARELSFTLRAVFDSPEGPRTAELNVTVLTNGLESFLVQSGIPQKIAPDAVGASTLQVTNHGLVERQFDVAVTDDPCGMQATGATGVVVGPKQTEEFVVTFAGPREKPYYFTQDCSLGITVTPSDSPGSFQSARLMVKIDGAYVDPVWVFWTLGIMTAIALIVFLVKRQKERVEEEVLGKPQKPWEIPAEKVYLEHLKEKDERAWYVVRHFLMEDEYASSLAWYHAYKGATKGGRKKERLIVKQERDFSDWEKDWEKRIAVPVTQADSYEAKLQKKLEKTAKKRRRRSLRRWRKQTRKLEKAHAKQQERALEKWEKKAKRADRKGRDIPEKPVVPEPEKPEEPRKEPAILADHPWQAKADRYRMRMAALQERLQERFEAQRGKRLKKVQKKVRKVARKLDDPDFTAEHPLLSDDAAADRSS